MKNRREQQAAERLDVGLELMAEIRFREHQAGEEGAERHRHARALHQQRRAEHDQQGRCRHHLARSGIGQPAEERIEQITAGEHDGRNRAGHEADRHQRFAPAADFGRVARRKQRQQGEQRHDRDILEQQDGDGALRVGLLELAALFEDLQRDGGRRQGEREADDDGAAPVDADQIRKAENHRRGDDPLRCAEAQNIAAHGDEAADFKLEPDHEHQHDDAEFGDRQDLLRRAEHAKPERADRDAGDEISDDRRERRVCARPAR